MPIARSLERRLERLLEGATGRVFSGRIHPSELAGRMAREADLAAHPHDTGPMTANRARITMNPRDVDANHDEIERELADALSDHAAEAGLRLEGPAQVEITTSDGVAPGQFTCELEIVKGPLPPWAKLTSQSGSLGIGPNRALVGRSPDADVVVSRDEISRRHALIWREGGLTHIQDLGSSNGTKLNGRSLGQESTELTPGDVVELAGNAFRFIEV